ncbi:BlaI/MecI/CopY family transcriptional regulator [Microbulbifer yueqingensis]|uniref:Predicted transcriptional regulator n=1 Tax=Microbulbifer yueqingensis TaxID=658219 RepID=A0A1G8UBT0_9GAMM|nr:BlaI/MecI/CopY family transcriptional regulator [Microbulbifer yueqingensis]SDJ51213.1 Predicted transcriptional regulator [Microbulbifer yueqingensis]
MNGPAKPTPALGDLEVAVLEIVWETPECSAKEVHERIGRQRGISLNTVQSTLERLHRKELLARGKRGHAYRYSACVERERLIASYIRETLGRFGGDAVASLAAFVDAAEDIDEASLARLEEELRKRRARKREE